MAFRSEPVLAIDLFHKPFMRHDLEALAQTIQNLILISPGTLPNDPLFGVGLDQYIFELLNDTTITTMQTAIEEQISRYIVHEDVTVSVEVKPMRANNRNVNSLLVTVRLYEAASASSRSEGDSTSVEVGFAYAGNTSTRKTASKIIL